MQSSRRALRCDWRARTAAAATSSNSRLPPAPLVPNWPDEHAHLLLDDSSEGLASLTERLVVGGADALARRLAVLDVASEARRASAVSALHAEWMSGRLAESPPPPPLPTPTALWAEAERLYASSAASRATAAAAAAAVDGASGLAAALAACDSEGSRCDALEALGLPWHHARALASSAPELRRRTLELRVCFWSDQMCERGTEVALFDYADAAERILGVSAFVLYDLGAPNNFEGAVAKFRGRFGERVVGLAGGWRELDGYLAAQAITVVYAIKCNNDHQCSKIRGVRTCIHCVFDATDPHGDVYAKISPCVPGKCAVVPHIVAPRAAEGPDLRAALGIPPTATVFGRYGGYESFDVEAAREAVLEVARRCAAGTLPPGAPDVYFVLMNTPPLCDADALEAARILHVARTSSDAAKARFIWTCDAMLHARSSGETFGLSVQGTHPTHAHPRAHPPRDPWALGRHAPRARASAHLSAWHTCCWNTGGRVLGGQPSGAHVARAHRPRDGALPSRHARCQGSLSEPITQCPPLLVRSVHSAPHSSDSVGRVRGAGLYYSTKDELVDHLLSFDRSAARAADHNAYRPFEPPAVMRTFERVFLSSRAKPPLPDWKRWGHRAGGHAATARQGAACAAEGGGGGGGSRSTEMLRRREEAHAEWRRGKKLQEDLGVLRALPRQEEVPAAPGCHYKVVSSRGGCVCASRPRRARRPSRSKSEAPACPCSPRAARGCGRRTRRASHGGCSRTTPSMGSCCGWPDISDLRRANTSKRGSIKTKFSTV